MMYAKVMDTRFSSWMGNLIVSVTLPSVKGVPHDVVCPGMCLVEDGQVLGQSTPVRGERAAIVLVGRWHLPPYAVESQPPQSLL